MLTEQKARTATAEGQDRSPGTTGLERREDSQVAQERGGRPDADAVQADAPAAEQPAEQPQDDAVSTESEQSQQPADGESVPAKTPAGELPVDSVLLNLLAPAAPVATSAPTAVVQPPASPAAAAVPVAPTAPAGTPIASAMQPVQQPVVPANAPPADAPDATTVANAVAVAADGDTGLEPIAGQPRPAAERAAAAPGTPAQAAPGQQGSANGDAAAGNGRNGQPGTLPQQAAEQARTVAQAYGRNAAPPNGEAPVAQPVAAPAAPAPTAPAAAPAAPIAQTVAPSSATPVPLARAAETVEHVLRLASARGVTHARLVLRPDELGSVDIHLRQTADGLTARVVATTPEAVQQLQHAAADLRRSLEQQGVNLIALDIGHSDDDRSAGRSGADAGEKRSGHAGHSAGDAAAGDAEATTDNKTLQLPNGVLVDVLA